MATKQQAAYIRELEAKIPKFLDMLNVGGFDLWEHCTPEVFTTFHGHVSTNGYDPDAAHLRFGA